MSLGTSNRDGGKTSESGHLRALGKLIAGHILNGLKVSQRGAGANMSVDVAIGDAMIPRSDGTYSHPVFNDAVYNAVITTADGSNPRRDIVVMYVDYNQTPSTAVSNNTNGVVKVAVVAGTPAGSPVDPSNATIQSAVGVGNPWIPLARVRVGAGVASISNSVIDDLRVPAQSLLQTATYSEIINAGCQVAQRAAVSLSSSYQYGQVDRFAVKGAGTAVSAGSITQTTSANIGDSGIALKVSGVTLTGTGKVFVRYRMESVDAKRFKNGIASFAVKVYHDVGSSINYIIRVQKPTVADNFASLTAIADSGNISVPSTTPTTIKFENINSGNLGDVSNGLEIEIEVGSGAITTKNFEFTEFQLAKGSVINTNFIARSIAEDLAACERYYLEVRKSSQGYSMFANCFVGNPVTFQLALPSTMRALPTVAYSALGHRFGGADYTLNPCAATDMTSHGVSFAATSSGTPPNGNNGGVWTNAGIFTLNAEL